jgi:hypothetical protein
MTALSNFFATQNEDVKKKAQKAVNAAADELGSIPISKPGNYLCEVKSFAYRDKKKNNAIRVFPEMFVSESKGSLNLTVSLSVIDGTSIVPKGASIFKNITLCPGAVNGQSPTDDTIEKVMRFTKPLLVTLTGTNKIELTEQWMEEWLLPKFEDKNNKLEMVKDHKMKTKVMVLVDHQLGTDQVIRLAVKNITRAQPGDKSSTFETAQPVSNMTIPTTTPAPAPSFANAVEADPEDIPHHVPEVEDFNA